MPMGSKPSVTEVEKDMSCTPRLCSLFLMIRIDCTIKDDHDSRHPSLHVMINGIVVYIYDNDERFFIESMFCNHITSTLSNGVFEYK